MGVLHAGSPCSWDGRGPPGAGSGVGVAGTPGVGPAEPPAT